MNPPSWPKKIEPVVHLNHCDAVAKSALGRGLGDLMESATKSAPLPPTGSVYQSGAPLDQGFQTILGKQSLEARIHVLPSEKVMTTQPSLSKHALLTDSAARFAVQALIAQDILLLTMAFMIMMGHPGKFQWIQAIVCSTLVILGTGCSVLAVCLAHRRRVLQKVQNQLPDLSHPGHFSKPHLSESPTESR